MFGIGDTIAVTPAYAILRAKVLVRANCRYRPGWHYLYKVGLVVGSNFEVLGRTEAGKWLLVQGVGDHDNACWVKADLMDARGDVMSVQPTYIPLPSSPIMPLRRAWPRCGKGTM